jgi:hypothetical protein
MQRTFLLHFRLHDLEVVKIKNKVWVAGSRPAQTQMHRSNTAREAENSGAVIILYY